MKRKNIFLSLVGLCSVGLLSAQITFTETQYFSFSVNNEGKVIVTKNQCEPYEIWDPETQGFTEIIGSISAGNGIGGTARFSDDGRKISSTMYSDQIPVYTEWQKIEPQAGETFIYKDICYRTETAAVTIGSSDDGQSGYILSSQNNGQTWKAAMSIESFTGTLPGMEAIGFQSYAVGLVGGHNGAMFITKSEARGWAAIDLHPEGNTDEVDTYWCIDFVEEANWGLATYGVIGMELKNGEGAVWYMDNGESFQVATGVTGVPQHITHFADTYYMVTRNGHIQTSTNHGQTWTDLFTTEGDAPLHRIKFLDEDNGMALSDGVVYVTTDGGKNWVKREVIAETPGINPLMTTEAIEWNDLVYMDDKVMIVGSKGAVYESSDKGANWTKVNATGSKETDLYAIAIPGNTKVLNICGAEGAFYLKELKDKVKGCAAGIYDIESTSSILLETSGVGSDESYSAAEGISGDGKIVIGGSYVVANKQTQYHAAAWSDELGFLDLGSKFADRNKSSKATKISYDGSVIVGWQDIWGPWYANVWRKNAEGGYDSKMMLKDPNKTEEDVDFNSQDDMRANLLGQCTAISADGKWIGGRGDALCAVGSPWIWSEESGLILLEGTGLGGNPQDMNNDATVVVGIDTSGMSPWIWTKETGKAENLNDYVTETLGYDLQGYYLCSMMDMSPNGRYVCGWCMKDMGKYAYVLDLKYNGNGIESAALDQCQASIYPNPASEELHIDLPYDNVATQAFLLDMQGRVVKSMNTSSVSNIMNLSDVTSGLYMLNVKAGGASKTFKVEVMH